MLFPLSQKQIDFLNTVNGVSAEFLEGTTASGKTTVGSVKFMRMVSKSDKKLHMLASRSVGIAEKNIIQQDNGILDLFTHEGAAYYGNGDRDYRIPHIKFEGKIIFVLGYDSREKWQTVLGSQFGCVYIDEINTAHIDFVREISTRNEYLLATLNPDNPDLPVYKEFINRSRPFKKYIGDVPKSILEMLTEPQAEGWRYWFFSFRDNLSLTAEDIERKKASAPAGTKLYKNKIQGIRCKATGLVFGIFGAENIVKAKDLKEPIKKGDIVFKRYSMGVDTAYSSKSPDTIAMIFSGITADGDLYILEERIFNNADRGVPLAPSDVVQEISAFADFCRVAWGDFRNVFIDSADQATLTECAKFKREQGSIYNFVPSYKDMKVLDRINLQLGWIAKKQFYVCDHNVEHIRELGTYSWQEDKDVPDDKFDHTINASQYAWLPFVDMIGKI